MEQEKKRGPGRPKGRPKGSKSRPKRALVRLLEEDFPNYRAVPEMIRAAQKLSQLADQAFKEYMDAASNKDEEAEEGAISRFQVAKLYSDALLAHDKVAAYTDAKLAAIKVDQNVKHTGGVLVVPARPNIEDWTKQAEVIVQDQEKMLLEHAG